MFTTFAAQRRPEEQTTTTAVATLADRLAYAAVIEQQRRWLERTLGVPIHELRPEAAAEQADPVAALAEAGTTPLLARTGGRPSGVAAVGPLHGDDGGFELTRVFVTPAARGNGVGRALVAAAADVARAAGGERLVLETHEPTMGPAVRLYRSLGFRDREPLGHHTHAGVITLELELAPGRVPALV
ncbi:GNAT family N-acetyltransferase [Nocardioides caldifontis]|uniref:GNAT family N-acetyltransferase n=1 Tax=Nocardioides caldifontis TaxID=2588938 RepID=UPI0011DF82E4|nr:GNAT family N-acetyltransferase [Nocardioides caldifontis]